MNLGSLLKKGKWIYYKHLSCFFTYFYKVDYMTSMVIYVSTFSYNKVMYILKLIGVTKSIRWEVEKT